MPSPLSADRPGGRPPGRGPVDALISQTRRLKGDVDAVRRQDARHDESDPQQRWQRALYDLALHQLNDLDEHLAQLREGPGTTAPQKETAPPPSPASRRESLLSRVGSAEWNLLTDEVIWSGELYEILGRDPSAPALTLDELPSLVHDQDRPRLTTMVTDCLVDAQRIDGEFRVRRPNGEIRTVHMMGEPVLGPDGSTASMWAVLRDVSELRRSQAAVSETRDSLQRHRHRASTERRLAVELQEAVLPQWRGSLRLARSGPHTLDLAARHLPASTGTLISGDWYDALDLPNGETLLGIGDLTGHGIAVTSDVAMLLGALRGMAMAGTRPGQLLSWLNQLLDSSNQPALGSAICCRYRPESRTLLWAQAGHPAPLLFRDGTGRRLSAPDGVLLGATSGAEYGEAEVTLEPGDLLLFHTDGLVPARRRSAGSGEPESRGGAAAVRHLLDLAPRFGRARSAQDCVRTVVEEFGGTEREDDACVLVVGVAS
ncbi:PP2C family protein-serine/threonine phosphatase [Streptomyces sp. NPDC088387]|uniref:PP2C family protein-serine/threonine phosphatase n=1 Tax=Streptomyces sp. NPDC088387 TaxID=3365859 RepID=UPI003825C12E